jgi:hypothetical protein
MCTLVLLLRPGHRWPLLIAANRDERLDRAADPPAAWWPDQPGIVGGRDRAAGGTWLALRPDGMVAAVLNRADSLGPAPGFRSRGELPLLALRHPDAATAARAIAARAESYRPYNLILADRAGAWFVRHAEGQRPDPIALPAGLHMVTARDPDDLSSARVARHLPRLRAAAAPMPPDWSTWQAILADRSGSPASQINIRPIAGFGTVSAARVAVPAEGPPVFEHAAGAPDRTGFSVVSIGSR